MSAPEPRCAAPADERRRLKAEHRAQADRLVQRIAAEQPTPIDDYNPAQVEAWVRWFQAAREKASARGVLDDALGALHEASPGDAAALGVPVEQLRYALDRRHRDATAEWDHWWAEETEAAHAAFAVGVNVREFPAPAGRGADDSGGLKGPRVAFRPLSASPGQ